MGTKAAPDLCVLHRPQLEDLTNAVDAAVGNGTAQAVIQNRLLIVGPHGGGGG